MEKTACLWSKEEREGGREGGGGGGGGGGENTLQQIRSWTHSTNSY